MMIFLRPLLTFLIMLSVSFASDSPTWHTNFSDAVNLAKKEKKLVFLDFNGSDWCMPCIKLKKDILDTPEFRKFAADKLIFLDVDLPRKAKISKSQLAANKKLVEVFQVKVYPTVIILNTHGLVVGGFVGGRTERSHVEAEVMISRERSERMQTMLARCNSLKGMDRAKLMLQIYEMLPMEMRAFNHMLKYHIEQIDVNDVLGLRKGKKELLAQRAQLEAIMDDLRNYSPFDIQGKLIIDQYLAGKLSDENRPILLMLRARAQISLSNTLEDIAKGKEFYIIAARADKSKTDEHMALIKKLFADPQAFLNRVKESRAASMKKMHSKKAELNAAP